MSGVIVAVPPPPPTGVVGLPGLFPPALGGGGLGGMSRWMLAAAALALALTGAGTVATMVAAPAPAHPPAVACSAGAVTGLSEEQRRNASAIIATGKALSVSERGQIVAVATAAQESTLRNLDYGDRDSLGLFQQRPSQGWGTPIQVRDPVYASRTFYRHLLGMPGWERWPVTVAAQKVQRSAFPNAYAKWEPLATALVTGTTCTKR